MIHQTVTHLTLLSSTECLANLMKPKTKLKLESRFTALKSYVECEISSLNSQFQSVCDKFKNWLYPNVWKDCDTSENNYFLQNEVALKDAIIKTLIETQTVILDSDTNFNSQGKDNMSFRKIAENSFMNSVSNSIHKRKNK